jgi:hypothetical protein
MHAHPHMEFQMQEKTGSPVSVPATLELTRTEELVLMRLTRQGCLSREQVCGIATSGHRSIKLSSVNGIVGGLRRKLAKHKIELVTVNGFGFELHRRDRAKALELLATSTGKRTDRTTSGVKPEVLVQNSGDGVR